MAVLENFNPVYRLGAALVAGALASFLAMHGFVWWSDISESAPIVVSAALFIGSMGCGIAGYILLTFAGHAIYRLSAERASYAP